jgi:hypothetical protein
MFSNKYILFLIGLTALMASCTEEIDIELGNTYTRLVVYGEVTTDTAIHYVKLTSSADYFFNKPAETIKQAIVKISDGDNEITLTQNPDFPGYYFTPSNFYGVPGKTYSLTIQNVDINEDGISEFYQASSYLPPSNPIDSVTLKYTSNSFFSAWEVQVWAWDPADKKDYYSFRVAKNGVMLTDTLDEYVVQSDDFFNGNFTWGITAQILNQANATEIALPGDTILFLLNGITRDYYSFILEAQAESFGSNPLFSGPPANITGNISNGALGFFSAYSIQRGYAVIPGSE